MDGAEFLQRLHPSKPQHRPLSSSKRLMRVFAPVIGPAAYLLTIRDTDFLHRRSVGPKTVSGDCLGAAMPFHQPFS
jgi:hypothetical protein